MTNTTFFFTITIVLITANIIVNSSLFTVRLLQPGQLEDNWPIATLIENKR